MKSFRQSLSHSRLTPVRGFGAQKKKSKKVKKIDRSWYFKLLPIYRLYVAKGMNECVAAAERIAKCGGGAKSKNTGYYNQKLNSKELNIYPHSKDNLYDEDIESILIPNAINRDNNASNNEHDSIDNDVEEQVYNEGSATYEVARVYDLQCGQIIATGSITEYVKIIYDSDYTRLMGNDFPILIQKNKDILLLEREKLIDQMEEAKAAYIGYIYSWFFTLFHAIWYIFRQAYSIHLSQLNIYMSLKRALLSPDPFYTVPNIPLWHMLSLDIKNALVGASPMNIVKIDKKQIPSMLIALFEYLSEDVVIPLVNFVRYIVMIFVGPFLTMRNLLKTRKHRIDTNVYMQNWNRPIGGGYSLLLPISILILPFVFLTLPLSVKNDNGTLKMQTVICGHTNNTKPFEILNQWKDYQVLSNGLLFNAAQAQVNNSPLLYTMNSLYKYASNLDQERIISQSIEVKPQTVFNYQDLILTPFDVAEDDPIDTVFNTLSDDYGDMLSKEHIKWKRFLITKSQYIQDSDLEFETKLVFEKRYGNLLLSNFTSKRPLLISRLKRKKRIENVASTKDVVVENSGRTSPIDKPMPLIDMRILVKIKSNMFNEKRMLSRSKSIRLMIKELQFRVVKLYIRLIKDIKKLVQKLEIWLEFKSTQILGDRITRSIKRVLIRLKKHIIPELKFKSIQILQLSMAIYSEIKGYLNILIAICTVIVTEIKGKSCGLIVPEIKGKSCGLIVPEIKGKSCGLIVPEIKGKSCGLIDKGLQEIPHYFLYLIQNLIDIIDPYIGMSQENYSIYTMNVSHLSLKDQIYDFPFQALYSSKNLNVNSLLKEKSRALKVAIEKSNFELSKYKLLKTIFHIYSYANSYILRANSPNSIYLINHKRIQLFNFDEQYQNIKSRVLIQNYQKELSDANLVCSNQLDESLRSKQLLLAIIQTNTAPMNSSNYLVKESQLGRFVESLLFKEISKISLNVQNSDNISSCNYNSIDKNANNFIKPSIDESKGYELEYSDANQIIQKFDGQSDYSWALSSEQDNYSYSILPWIDSTTSKSLSQYDEYEFNNIFEYDKLLAEYEDLNKRLSDNRVQRDADDIETFTPERLLRNIDNIFTLCKKLGITPGIYQYIKTISDRMMILGVLWNRFIPKYLLSKYRTALTAYINSLLNSILNSILIDSILKSILNSIPFITDKVSINTIDFVVQFLRKDLPKYFTQIEVYQKDFSYFYKNKFPYVFSAWNLFLLSYGAEFSNVFCFFSDIISSSNGNIAAILLILICLSVLSGGGILLGIYYFSLFQYTEELLDLTYPSRFLEYRQLLCEQIYRKLHKKFLMPLLFYTGNIYTRWYLRFYRIYIYKKVIPNLLLHPATEDLRRIDRSFVQKFLITQKALLEIPTILQQLFGQPNYSDYFQTRSSAGLQWLYSEFMNFHNPVYMSLRIQNSVLKTGCQRLYEHLFYSLSVPNVESTANQVTKIAIDGKEIKVDGTYEFEKFYRQPNLYMQTTPSKAYLLVGRPNAGKTYFAKSFAAYNHLPMVYLDLGRLLSKRSDLIIEFFLYGDTGMRPILDYKPDDLAQPDQKLAVERLTKIDILVSLAARMAPCLIWVPDLQEYTTDPFLNELRKNLLILAYVKIIRLMQKNVDYSTNPKMMFIASSNNTRFLDPLLLIRNRFETIINVEIPDPLSRKDRMLSLLHIKGMTLTNDFDFTTIRNATMGFGMSEISAVIERLYTMCFNLGSYSVNTILMTEAIHALEIEYEIHNTPPEQKYYSSKEHIAYKLGRALVKNRIFPQPFFHANNQFWQLAAYYLSRFFFESRVSDSTITHLLMIPYFVSIIAGLAAKDALIFLRGSDLKNEDEEPLEDLFCEDVTTAAYLFRAYYSELGYASSILNRNRFETLKEPCFKLDIDFKTSNILGILGQFDLQIADRQNIGDINIHINPEKYRRNWDPNDHDLIQYSSLIWASSGYEYRMLMSRHFIFDTEKHVVLQPSIYSLHRYGTLEQIHNSYRKFLTDKEYWDLEFKKETILYHTEVPRVKVGKLFFEKMLEIEIFTRRRTETMEWKQEMQDNAKPSEHHAIEPRILAKGGRMSITNPKPIHPRHLEFNNRDLVTDRLVMSTLYDIYYDDPMHFIFKPRKKPFWYRDEQAEKIQEKIEEKIKIARGLTEDTWKGKILKQFEDLLKRHKRTSPLHYHIKITREYTEMLRPKCHRRDEYRYYSREYKHPFYDMLQDMRPREGLIRHNALIMSQNSPNRKNILLERFMNIHMVETYNLLYKWFIKNRSMFIQLITTVETRGVLWPEELGIFGRKDAVVSMEQIEVPILSYEKYMENQTMLFRWWVVVSAFEVLGLTLESDSDLEDRLQLAMR